jgi:GT2 family glycosyltransferase
MGTMLAEGEFLCFINDDVELSVDSLAKQVPLIDENPEIGMVGPRGAMWPALEPGTYAGENTITDVDAISGFMFITRRSIFDAIGGFDVAFTPAGCEEIDFAFAVRHAGFRCTVVPETNVIHHSSGGVSSRDMEIDYLGKRISTSDLAKKNLRLFQEKWRNK